MKHQKQWRQRLSHRLSLGLLGAFALALTPPASAYHPNHPVGFTDPERAVQGSQQVDLVDLYSGSLSVVIPVGPWSLTYSSNVWQYTTDTKDDIVAGPDRQNTAGLGWHLGWGEVYHPDAWYNESDRWLYVGSDGGRHTFYETLHRDDGDDGDNPPPVGGGFGEGAGLGNRVFYTRDGSYLRMHLAENGCSVEIKFPDGTTNHFVGSCGPDTPLQLTKVWNTFGSEADPDLTITYGIDTIGSPGTPDTLRTAVDRYGLTHRVFLADNIGGTPLNLINRIVTRIEMDSFDEGLAVYDFHYRQEQVDVSCKDTSSTTALRIPLAHLTAVDLPGGTSYTMEDEAGNLLYYNQCEEIGGETVDDLPGVLKGINLPTGGKIRWDFEEREFPPGDTNSPFTTSASVKTRTLHPSGPVSAATALGSWNYKWTAVAAADSGIPDEPFDPEMHVEVVYPTGDCSKHYFNAIYWVDPVTSTGQPRGWETGLPFVYRQDSGGKHLSSQIFSANNGAGSCDATSKVRSTYLRFRRDTAPGQGTSVYPKVDWVNTNRQAEAQRVVYHEASGDRVIDTESTEFDGLGHFRRTVSTGDFWAGSNHLERRETYTAFTRSTGVYPGTYTAVQITEPWVLGVFDVTEVTEPDGLGETTVKAEYGFEDTTGFLHCSRLLASGTSRSDHDLLLRRNHDTRGRVIDVKQFGSDLQTLSTAGGNCGATPSPPATWTTHAYDPLSGTRINTRARTASGGDGPFLLYDVDVEAKTGLVLAERDPGGFEITYGYDVLGRLTSMTPEEGARVEYQYVNATAVNQPRVTTLLFSQINGLQLTSEHMIYDDLGRLVTERRQLPGGVWSSRDRQYNARGWTTAISQWDDHTVQGATTQYLAFDPFGRPSVIRPPDGASHDLKITRVGDWQVTQQTKVALAGGEAYVSRTMDYDRYGRLRRVAEPSGVGGAATPTTYSYDVGGRLTEMATTVPSTVQGEDPTIQVRAFGYDNRGLLLSETLPEKGATGNGTTVYEDYDVRGLAHGMVDGPHSLAFTYDLLGRPLTTRDRNQLDVNLNPRILTDLLWDGTTPSNLGKLRRAQRYNYLDLPWTAAGEDEVMVQQLFTYDGLGDAVSQKTTKITWPGSSNVRFKQEYTYNEYGEVASMTFPYCDLPAACANTSAPATGRVLTYTYDKSLLTGVPGWASSITYHPSGAWKEVTHANGVTDHRETDTQFSQRTKRLYTSGVTASFDTGVMAFDGAGNLKTMGTHAFTYDEVSRLVEASYLGGVFDQSYTYDPFGNLTGVDGLTSGPRSFAVNPAINRLSDATYDGAGNMLTAPPSIPATPFTYDTTNQLVGQAHLRYVYDASGERTASISVHNPNPGAIFHLRDLGQRFVTKITLDNNTWTRDRDYIYAGDRLLARASTGSGSDRNFHLDHLGNVRLVTNGTELLAPGDFHHEYFLLPYGEEQSGVVSLEDSPLFTGHERDGSTGADYMHARHYLWSLGRFFSVDPLGGSPGSPQSLNRYAYVLGNPINLTDPSGMEGKCANGEDIGFGICVDGGQITVTDSFIPSDRLNISLDPAGTGADARNPDGSRYFYDLKRLPLYRELPDFLQEGFRELIDVVGTLPPPDPMAPNPPEIDPNAQPLPKCSYITRPKDFSENMNFAENRIRAGLEQTNWFLPLGPAVRGGKFGAFMAKIGRRLDLTNGRLDFVQLTRLKQTGTTSYKTASTLSGRTGSHGRANGQTLCTP